MYLDENSQSMNHRSSFDDSFERSKERTGEEYDRMVRQTSLTNVLPGANLFSNQFEGREQIDSSYQNDVNASSRLFEAGHSPRHGMPSAVASDRRLMVDLDHEQELDNFLKGTEYDIFNQADTPAYRGGQIFECQSDYGQDARERSLAHTSHQQHHPHGQSQPFHNLAAERLPEQQGIHGPFEHREPSSCGVSQKSYTLPTGPSSRSLGSEVPNFDASRHSKPVQAPLQLEKQGSDEAMLQGTPAYHISTNEYSADTYSRSKGTSGDQGDSLSDEDDAIYVPFEYKGDGRKREAKKHKLQALVAQDEIMIDRMIRDYQNSNDKIIESERALDMLKTKNISKKELQSKRNRLTAQLSRDRQKLEMSFLKAMCVNYQRLLRRLDKKLCDKTNKPFCPSCWSNLNQTMQHHRSNQTQPTMVNFGSEMEPLMDKSMPLTNARPTNEEVEEPKSKRQKLTPAVSTSELPGKKSGSQKRKDKADQKSNKGLIASSMMLSVVGMLNYMGNQEMPVCTQLDEKFSNNQEPLDQFRTAQVAAAKAGLDTTRFGAVATPRQMPDNDWSIENVNEGSFDAGFDVEQYALDLVVPGSQQQMQKHGQQKSQGIMNATNSATGLSLEDAYVAFDMRESYLQRHASPMAKYSDQTDLQIKDFSTKTNNMWRSDELELFPDYQPSCASNQASHDNIYQAKYSHMEQNTQSMFCPTANLIAPFQESKGPKALMHDKDGDGRSDVILEKDESGNTYLHLVMPATAVNFLNGSDGSNLFNFAAGEGASAYEEPVDDVFVELGCKVYEVNRVQYRGGELNRVNQDASSDSLYNASV